MPRKFTIGDLSAPRLSTYSQSPGALVDLLGTYHGDVTEFCHHFFDDKPIEILSKTMSMLNDRRYLHHKQRWDSLIEAFEQAKFMLAKRKAIQLIGDYEPDPENMDVSKFTTYSRFWMASHAASETTRAKRQATFAPPPGEADELSDIIDEMTTDLLPDKPEAAV